ncbi:sigma-54-dependent transcriptional regulator [Alkalimarinus coralli]|uniref:sigma-54-dependent transcriptional regulator n=1 Tax=Alkalimarinus coralli TaxID=2935863 RepID=UPI0023DE8DFA|nr:sigma-54 dependent transcriptional regulator [Alkalimarinus coralli]
MAKTTILIVEDDRELREALSTTLEIAGYECITADSAESAIPILEKRTVELVVSDVNMPGMNGHELLEHIHRQFPGIPAMLITAYGQISDAVSAMQSGAVDYIVKPFEPSVLIESVKRVLGTVSTSKEGQPVAEDPFSRQLFQLARKVAASDSTVMIAGESGTGKEVLARYIHACSPRASQPFIALNCAAIPENMLEAILFGHEKGAYTGAYNSAPGKFEQANGGTILLDEISEMDLGLQAKLLRVIQEREVERVGGRKTISLDVRVLATTNRDLKEYVAEGKFREDLYYRLSVFPMQWKPLRERPLDIVPLAERLLSDHIAKMKLPPMAFDQSAKSVMQQYDWPGNVRELDNAVQRALILQQGNVISQADLCLDAGTGQNFGGDSLAMNPANSAINQYASDVDALTMVDGRTEDSLEIDGASVLGQDLKQREFKIIIDMLRKEKGRKKQTAEKLGISPRTLRYKMARMRECGIDLDAEMSAA